MTEPTTSNRAAGLAVIGLLVAILVAGVIVSLVDMASDADAEKSATEDDYIASVERTLFDYSEQEIYDQVDGTLPADRRWPAELRDELVDVGYAMCNTTSAEDNTALLEDHSLGVFATQWALINEAAVAHLCG